MEALWVADARSCTVQPTVIQLPALLPCVSVRTRGHVDMKGFGGETFMPVDVRIPNGLSYDGTDICSRPGLYCR